MKLRKKVRTPKTAQGVGVGVEYMRGVVGVRPSGSDQVGTTWQAA
jgi:hypothetical protein